MNKKKVRLAVFASGAGSNARVIMQYFKDHPHIEVALVVTNRFQAGVTIVAEEAGVDWVYIPKADLEDKEIVLSVLAEYSVDWIILAGWLLLIPPYLIEAFYHRIINIHPALLPKFGGKGMYGMHVHQAVMDAGETESGITIHLVDEHYDRGDILFQERVPVDPGDTAEAIQKKVQGLEHRFFPKVIEDTVLEVLK